MKKSGYFDKAKIKLILDHPFFAVLAVHLQEKEMDLGHPIIQQLLMPTVGVDGQNLFVNPEFVKGLSDAEMIGLLAHEVCHVAFGHVWPWRKQWREHKKWNKAGDYVINKMLKDEGFSLPKGGLHDKSYDGMSVEEVYSKLEDQEQKGGGGGKGGWEDILPAMGGPNGDNKKSGDGKGSKALTPHEQEQLEQEWKERLVEAAHVAKLKGKLPAGLERFVDDLVTPKVPWYVLLEQFVNEVVRDDYNELMHDRRFIQQGIYLPDMYSEGCSVVVALDTSGSVGPDELRAFASEAVGILRSRSVKSIRIFACDAEITLDENLSAWDPIPEEFPGGGGTDFRPVFEAVEDSFERPACLVYMTDGYGSYPEDPPPYPVLWVMPNEYDGVPFGTRIQFDLHDIGIEVESAGA